MTKIFDKKNIIGLILGGVLIVISLFFLNSKAFYLIIALAVIISALPFIISIILQSGKQKEVDEKFLEFIRDLVENVKSGTPISKGIQNLKSREYGHFSPHVQKLANQIALGIPLTNAMTNMANDTKSKTISRAVNLISRAERAGGEIDTILESVANSVNQTENLKNERKTAIYNLIVQGYIIFLVFIVIMLVLQYKILPLAEELTEVGLETKKAPTGSMYTPMLVLLLVQSFFTGLVIGKISEGSFKEGIKHSFILVALALIITGAARVFFST
jgi:flagellar protein FlaJ